MDQGLRGSRADGLDVEWLFGGGDEDGDWAIGIAHSDEGCCDICRGFFKDGDWVVWSRYGGKERVSHFLQHRMRGPHRRRVPVVREVEPAA